ncbi:MAG: hypothetical protein GW823_06560 [Bacteroidetes bacterium]|nr:hypothetical protein [Bacteroidota bacterium]
MKIRYLLILLLFILCLNHVSLAQTRLFLQTDNDFYYSGETISLAIWPIDATSLKAVPFSETLRIDLVDAAGKVIFTKNIFSSPYQLNIALPEKLKSAYYRLVCNFSKTKPTVLTFPIYSLQDADKSASNSNRTPSFMRAKALSGKLVKNGMEPILLRVFDENLIGVSTLVSVFDENDSLLTFVQTDKNGIASIKQNETSKVYKFVSNELSTVLTVSESTPIHFKVSAQKDSIKINVDLLLNNSDSLNVSSYSVSIHQNANKIQTFDIPKDSINKNLSFRFSRNDLPQGLLTIQLDSLQTSVQEQLISNFHVEFNKKSVVSQIASTIFEVSSVSSTENFAVKIYDAKKLDYKPTSLQHKLLFQATSGSLYPMNFSEDRFLDFYTALGVFNSTNLQQYVQEPTISDFDCKAFDGKILSFLVNETWQGIQIPCDSIQFYDEILKRYIQNKSSVFAYSFNTDRKHLEKITLEISTKVRYPAINLSLDINEANLISIREQKKIKQIASIYDTSENREKASLHFDKVYRLKDYNFPSTMNQTLAQVVSELSISISLKDKVTQMRIYPYMTRNTYPDSPLILINDIPSFEIDDIFQIDPNNVDSIAIINTYLSFKQLDYFGKNGVLAIYLKLGVDNPLENSLTSVPSVSQEPTTNFDVQNSGIDLRPVLYWNSTISAEKTSYIKFVRPSYESTFNVQIQGFSENGNLMESVVPISNQ